MKKHLLTMIAVFMSAFAWAQDESSSGWTDPSNEYKAQTVVYLAIDCGNYDLFYDESGGRAYYPELAAFIGDELREVVVADPSELVSPEDKTPIYTLRVGGTTADEGKEIESTLAYARIQESATYDALTWADQPWTYFVKYNYTDGTSDTVTSGYEVSPTYFDKTGTHIITVTYEECETTFTVNVSYTFIQWIIMILLTREFLLTSFRLVASSQGVVIAAGIWGKLKTVSQMVFSMSTFSSFLTPAKVIF